MAKTVTQSSDHAFYWPTKKIDDSPPELLVGLDCGQVHTGVSIWKCDNSKRVHFDRSGTLTIDSFSAIAASQPSLMAQVLWESTLLPLIANASSVELVAEGYIFGSSFLSLGQAETMGAIKHKILDKGCTARMSFINPASIKKAIAGSGKATKSSVVTAVKKKWGFSTRSSHEADAIAVVIAFLTSDSVFTDNFLRNRIDRHAHKEFQKRPGHVALV